MYFVTSNKNKYNEMKGFIPSLKMKDIDLKEIQSLSIEEVVNEKLEEGKTKINEPFICEDVSLEINTLNKFPGPLVKWFMKTLSLEDINKILSEYSDKTATAIAVIGYYDGEESLLFKGEVNGKIVSKKGSRFGFDPIFQPEGSNKTFGEMSIEEKARYSHRMKATRKLKEHIQIS